jgi:hypothetical protein
VNLGELFRRPDRSIGNSGSLLQLPGNNERVGGVEANLFECDALRLSFVRRCSNVPWATFLAYTSTPTPPE